MLDGKRTAVVADDDADLRTVVTGILEGAGWRVIAVDDGEKAVFAAVDHGPDLVMLDVMMPGGDGISALKALREDVRTEHIPVIMLTAVNDYALGKRHTPESLSAELGVRGPERLLEKPVDQQALLHAVAAVMGA
jgi:CheY-like chemotaxis protein